MLLFESMDLVLQIGKFRPLAHTPSLGTEPIGLTPHHQTIASFVLMDLGWSWTALAA
jgi:hypothetical protein